MTTTATLAQARQIAKNIVNSDSAVSSVEIMVDLGSVTMSIWFDRDGQMFDHNPADR